MIRILLPVVALLIVAADWPQYRGPTRNDISPEKDLNTDWTKTQPGLAWNYEGAGVGYSPPAVVGERVYITGGREEKEFLIALNSTIIRGGSVKELWATEIGPTFRFKSNSWSAGPSATPTVDGELIYAIGGNGDLICVNTNDGTLKWKKNLPKDFSGSVNPIGGGPKDLGWGYTGSPLIDGDQLILAVGGSKGTLAALNKTTGELIWRSSELKDQAAYTSPMLANIGDKKQYVILTNQGLAGIDAKDGKLLWQHVRKPSYGTEVINTPLIDKDHIYTTVAAGNGECEVVKIEKNNDAFVAKRVYGNKNLLNHHGNVILVGEHIFGHSQSGGWTCQSFKTGEVAWSERRGLPGGSCVYADGHLFCYTENNGTAAVVEASTEKWIPKGTIKLPNSSKLRAPQGKVWTPPIIANGMLFLRDQELLFCFDLKKK